MASVEDFHEVDDILNLFGNPGWFQIIQFAVLSLQYVPLAMNDFIPVFYGMPPLAVQCRERGDFNSSFSDPDDLPVNGTDKVLMGEYRNASDIYSCHCRHGFTYEYPGRQWSIIADMNLVCGKAALVNLSTIIYVLGQIVATFFSGMTADKFGRRPVLLLSNLFYAILTLALVFSRDFTSFILLRFFVGVARQGMNSSFFVLLMEWIPRQRRGPWAAMAQVLYTIGVLLLTLVAFLVGNWIYIQAFLAAMTVLSIPLYWFAPESLAWLCLHRKVDQVVINCNQVASFNGIKLSHLTLEKIRRFAKKPAAKGEAIKTYSFLDCFRTPNVRRTTLLCCFSWLSCYLGYLGLSLLSIDIAGDVYLNLAINGLLEFIPITLAYVVASRFGNKVPLVIYFLIGGILSFIAGCIPGNNPAEIIGQNIIAFISRMAFVGCCCVIFVFTSELFPTVIRNNGFNLCSVALRIGLIITPVLGLMATPSYKGGGFILVGLTAIISAGSSCLLRETKGQPLPDTIEEAENLGPGEPIEIPKTLRRRNFPPLKENTSNVAESLFNVGAPETELVRII